MLHLNSARLRLTLWYISIVAIVSFAFSAIIYKGVTSEIERSFQSAEFRIRNHNGLIIPPRVVLEILNEDFERAKHDVAIRLITIDAVIILASGIAAYILAGKTLEPIEKALEEQKRFTADASHELKTPLTSLRTELEVAIRDKKINLNEAKRLLKSNLEEVISLQKLSENLMRLTKYSQTNNGIILESVDLADLIKESLKIVVPMAKKKEIKIVNETNNINVKADKLSLIELFVILLDNAIKYSPKKTTIDISLVNQKNKVIIEIKDQGMGISREDLPHLFDRFYRADLSRNKSQVDGYGLGLAIAKEIVDKHNGSISVQSLLGKGSTFKVVLPS